MWTPFLVAAWLLVIGAGMLFGGDGAYTSGSFTVAFEIMPRRAWGAAFLAAGLLWFVTNGKGWAFLPMAIVVPTYALALLAAVVTGDSESLTGWAWPSMVASVLLITAAHRGIETRYP